MLAQVCESAQDDHGTVEATCNVALKNANCDSPHEIPHLLRHVGLSLDQPGTVDADGSGLWVHYRGRGDGADSELCCAWW